LIKVPGTLLERITNIADSNVDASEKTHEPKSLDSFELICVNTDPTNLLVLHGGTAQSEFSGDITSLIQYLKDVVLDNILAQDEAAPEVNILMIISKMQNEENNEILRTALSSWSAAISNKHTIYVVSEQLKPQTVSDDSGSQGAEAFAI